MALWVLTRNAIKDFQEHSGLPGTGQLDDATLNLLPDRSVNFPKRATGDL